MQAELAVARAAGPGQRRRSNSISEGALEEPYARVDGLHRWLCRQTLVCRPWLYTSVWHGRLYVAVYWRPVPALLAPEVPLLRSHKWHTTLAIVEPTFGPQVRGYRRRLHSALWVIRRRWLRWLRRLLPAPVPRGRYLRLALPDSDWSWNLGIRGVERAACWWLHQFAARMLERIGQEVRTPVGGMHISWNL